MAFVQNQMPTWFPAAVHIGVGLPFKVSGTTFRAAGNRMVIDRLISVHPRFKPLFESCEWGADADSLVFRQIPQRPGTSHEPGWHDPLATDLATVLHVAAPTFTGSPNYRPDQTTATIAQS